jgi:hypothetical protein
MTHLLSCCRAGCGKLSGIQAADAERSRNTIRFDAGNSIAAALSSIVSVRAGTNYQNALPLVRTQSQYSVAKQILPILHLQIAPMNQSAISDDVPDV